VTASDIVKKFVGKFQNGRWSVDDSPLTRTHMPSGGLFYIKARDCGGESIARITVDEMTLRVFVGPTDSSKGEINDSVAWANRTSWEVDLYHPDSLRTLLGALVYLERHCVHTLSIDEADGQKSFSF